MSSEKKKELADLHPKAYTIWSPEDDQYLEENIGKLPISAMSRHVQRPVSSVLKRIAKLGLDVLAAKSYNNAVEQSAPVPVPEVDSL